MKATFKKYSLDFKFDAGTSRGVLKTKETWFIQLWESDRFNVFGIGEAGPLKGLSPDDRPDFESKLKQICAKVENFSLVQLLEQLEAGMLSEVFDLKEFPSIVFALETSLLDLKHQGKRILYKSSFTQGQNSIPINGLVWMGDKTFMHEQIQNKLESGFSCIKMKIGAIDFDTECELLSSIRENFSPEQIILRVDANGAFSEKDVFEKLERLSEYYIHSIEQPVKAGQYDLMEQVCLKGKVPVALDEELIGVYGKENKKALLEKTKPQYIILKPTLLGGIEATREWISIAEELHIGWWITSALESNIGLNAVSQLTATLNINNTPQGLGTGMLYRNNLESPLVVKSGKLYHNPQLNWNLKGMF